MYSLCSASSSMLFGLSYNCRAIALNSSQTWIMNKINFVSFCLKQNSSRAPDFPKLNAINYEIDMDWTLRMDNSSFPQVAQT